MTDSPILIGSAPSSGSTLLSVLLDAHPEVTCGPELAVLAHPGMYARPWEEFRAEFLDNLRPWAWDTQDAADRLGRGFCPYALAYVDNLPYYGLDLDGLRALARSADGPDDFLARLYRPLRTKTGKERWAEKSPSNLYAFEAFLARFPAGRVVYLVRNGLDLVASLLKRGFGLKRAVAVWLVETLLCERLRDHPRACRVEYEELAARPRETVARVLEFLELAPEADAVLAAAAASPRLGADATARGVATWRNRPGGPITTQSVGRWRDGLGESALAVCLSARIVADPPGVIGLAGVSLPALLEQLGHPVPAAGQPEGVEELLGREHFLAQGADYLGSHLFQERYVAADWPALPADRRRDLRAESRFALQAEVLARTRRILHQVGRNVLDVAGDVARIRGRWAAMRFWRRPGRPRS
jgi:hypothetical protein